MLRNLRSIASIGFGVAVWGVTFGVAQAQFGGLQIQIGRSGGPYGGSGLYMGGFNVPFGVGPSIPPSSRAYMGPQYQSGYRGYYGNFGVAPSLGVYSYSPYDLTPDYGNYGYSNRHSLDLYRYQLELQAAQRILSAQQAYPYGSQSPYSVQPPRVSSSTSDLRLGMVLPDGSTVISVGPTTPIARASQQPNSQQPNSQQPSGQQPNSQQPNSQQPNVQPNVLPSGSPKPSRASF